MKRLLLISTLTLWVLNSIAQEFGTHWISYPLPDDSTEILFRRTFKSEGYKPHKATITVATTGKIRIYVNERNISREVAISNRGQSVSFYTYDVTRFMQPDSNIIAVWYAPNNIPYAGKQLSLEFYGIDYLEKSFYYHTDKSWFCKSINTYAKEGQEYFDATTFPQAWKYIEQNTRGWLRPLGANSHDKSTTKELYPLDSIYILAKKISPIAVTTDSVGTVHADFGRPFSGTVRLTLRNAKRGEHIVIDNFTYVCTGEMDEQCFRRFTESNSRIIRISGDSRFNPKQIQNIEGLDMELQPHKTYLY